MCLVPARAGNLRSRTFTHPDTNNLAPRVGFALLVAPMTVLRGAYGIFYAALGYQEARLTGAANLPHFVRVAFRTPADAATSRLVLANGFPEGVLDPRNATNPDGFAASSRLRTGEVHQWSLGIQQQILPQTIFSLTYVGSKSAHLRAFNNVNAPVPAPGRSTRDGRSRDTARSSAPVTSARLLITRCS